jgi:hypothetical protein
MVHRRITEGKHSKGGRALQSGAGLGDEREKRLRLVRELSKLDCDEERRMAEEGLGDASWPLVATPDD